VVASYSCPTIDCRGTQVSDSSGWSAPDGRPDKPQDPQPNQPPPDQPPLDQPPLDQPPRAYPPPPPLYHAPKPGVIPLRPLGLSEILDGAITTMRTYPKQMLGVSAIVSTIANLLTTGVLLVIINGTNLLYAELPQRATEADIAVENLRITLILAAPSLVITILARMFLSGLLTIVIGKAVLGQPVSTGEAWRHIRPRFGALIGVSLLYTLMVWVAVFAFVIPGVWLYVMFSLASTALILEGAKVGRSFGRSRLLVRGAWWRTFGILLLAALIAGILNYIIQIPFNLIGGGLNAITGTGPQPDIAVVLLLTAIGAIIAETFTLPFSSGVTTLLYVDRRMRREGMDIELARQAGTTPPPTPTAW
jgi:hypothetical protein